MMEKPERRIKPEPDKRAGAIAERDGIAVIQRSVARRARPTWN